MNRTVWLTCLAISGSAACFPDPPKPASEETVVTDTNIGDGPTSADSAVGGDLPLDEDARPPEDGDLAFLEDSRGDANAQQEAETELDTATAHDTISAEAVDTEVLEITTDTEGASETIVPECGRSADCAHLVALCSDGVCTNGKCVVSALNGVTCDDGDPCTQSDMCRTGLCQGEPVVCDALDTCHDAGECDLGTGRCTDPIKPDSATCDDGLKCTDNDTCQDGQCRGSPRICEASDQCHTAGECHPLTGFCSNPAKPNFTPCDDGDICTTNDQCSLGKCDLSLQPDDTQGDWLLVLEGDGDVQVHAMAEKPDGSVAAIGHAKGNRIDVRRDGGVINGLSLGPDHGCSLFFLNVSADGSHATSTLLGGAVSCTDDEAIAAGLALVPLADGTFIVGGFYRGGPYEFNDGSISVGVSPSGLLVDFGMWVGRLQTSTRFAWITTLIGGGLQGGDTLYRGLAATPLGAFWHATATSAGGAIEVVYGSDDSEVLLNTETGVGTGYLFEFSATGRRTRTSEITCAGACSVQPLFLTRNSSGDLIVGGLVRGGSVTAKGPTPASNVLVSTGLTTDFEGWVVGYDQAGPRWGRSFFSDYNGVQKGSIVWHGAPYQDGLMATAIFGGRARTRLGENTDALLVGSETTAPQVPNASYWFAIDKDGGVDIAGRLEPVGSFGMSVAANGANRFAVAGARNETLPPGTDDVEVAFVTQPGVWERVIAQPSGAAVKIIPRLVGASPLHVAITANGVLVAANIAAPATVGVGSTLALNPPEGKTHATIMRINSRHGLECE